eukprot:10463717-Karenia_brevis.AAC.1
MTQEVRRTEEETRREIQILKGGGHKGENYDEQHTEQEQRGKKARQGNREQEQQGEVHGEKGQREAKA